MLQFEPRLKPCGMTWHTVQFPTFSALLTVFSYTDPIYRETPKTRFTSCPNYVQIVRELAVQLCASALYCLVSQMLRSVVREDGSMLLQCACCLSERDGWRDVLILGTSHMGTPGTNDDTNVSTE